MWLPAVCWPQAAGVVPLWNSWWMYAFSTAAGGSQACKWQPWEVARSLRGGSRGWVWTSPSFAISGSGQCFVGLVSSMSL